MMGSLMEFSYNKDYIELKDKELSELDEFVINFTRLLKKHFNYVIISGYVAILFGRNRSSEDIDVFIGNIPFDNFKKFWEEAYKKYVCINTKTAKNAYYNYLSDNIPIRFSLKDEFIPNFELKFPKSELDKWTLSNKKEVLVDNYELFISPLELEIPYKLYLGSEKDIEDARFLYRSFEANLDMKVLEKFNQKLKTNELFRRYIK